MGEFDEFRVVLTPDLAAPGHWNLLLEDCVLKGMTGPKGSVQPAMTRAQLVRLRSQHGWPNLQELREIGQGVWNSLMTPKLEGAFEACRELAPQNDRGLRLVVTIVGEEQEPATPGGIRIQELPVEALCSNQSFLAKNPATPVSRGLRFKPDRDSLRITLPMRILVVAARPEDTPDANVQAEKDAIDEALKTLIKLGSVERDYCEPPTGMELCARLQQKRYHILHFVTHGGFDIFDDDPSPRPCLLLEKSEADHSSDPLDADTLGDALQGSSVRLVVMTACSSAAPTPDEEPYRARAFDGIAQRLVGGDSGVSAAVAMQFDLEAPAAVAFSKIFYTNLLRTDRPLDEIVALCRQALAVRLKAGHRAWVTPVVYSRCQGGKVFDLEAMKANLDPEAQQELIVLDRLLDIYLRGIIEAGNMAPDKQAAAAPLVQIYQCEVNRLLEQRGQVLGDSLRLYGGAVKPGESLQCQLTLRLRTPAQVGTVQVQVSYPSNKVDFLDRAPGADVGGNPELVNPALGQFTLRWPNVSGGAEWEPGEFELAILNFRLREGLRDPVLNLTLAGAHVQKDGADLLFDGRCLSGVLFVT